MACAKCSTCFFEETADRLTLMRQLSCQDDRVRIEDEAHTLKGAAGTFGLAQLSELARTLELSANTITPGDYRNLLDRLDACFQRARAGGGSGVTTAH